MRRGILVTGLALTVAGAGAGSAQQVEVGAEAAFEEAYAEFSRGYRDGDPGAVAALYAEDALYLAPGDSIARGDVRRHFDWLASFEPGRGPLVEFTIVDREVSGDLGYDIGYYRIRPAGAPEAEASVGKFVVVWKRGADGVWRIHADGFSHVGGGE